MSKLERMKQVFTLRNSVISLLFILASVFLWTSFELEKELPQDGYVMTFDRAYRFEALQKVSVAYKMGGTLNKVAKTPTAVVYDSAIGDLAIRMVKGHLGYQMDLPVLTGHMDLSSEGSIVLSREQALKTYGRLECVGRSYTLLGRTWTVAGVVDTSSETGRLAQAQDVGGTLKAIIEIPKSFALGRWGLGVNNLGTSAFTKKVYEASKLGSPKMSSESDQVDVWLAYESSLLTSLPWRMSQWGRSTEPTAEIAHLSSLYSLAGIWVVDTSEHGELTHVYRLFSAILYVFCILVYVISIRRR